LTIREGVTKLPRFYLRYSYVFGYVGFGCIVAGIISDAIEGLPGLEPVSWFLMAISFLIIGRWFWAMASKQA
jgi:hypothetical protein